VNSRSLLRSITMFQSISAFLFQYTGRIIARVWRWGIEFFGKMTRD
jgi:hypothetical protein